jgi:ATP-dependent helicase/nuclease subunit A
MKMKWTNKQLDAINHSGENILVSAGAGSGKTAILSERVIRILKEGTHINELLILTFTKAASEEMKERIRKKIIKNELYSELELLDSSYITTFDSYALSIVKKYHYLLNLDKNINIMDESILKIEKDKIINEVLEKYYSLRDEDIMFLIKTMLRKDDELLKEGLASLIDKIDLEIDTNSYLEHIKNIDITTHFNNIYNNYLSSLLSLIKEIEDILFEMENYIETTKDEDVVSKCSNYFSTLINCKSYDAIKHFIVTNKALNLGKI